MGIGAIAVTHRDYGSNWDEGVQSRYGELVVDYFSSGLKDTRCNDFINLRYYGPLAEVIPAVVYGRSGAGKYEVRHVFVALLALMTIPAIVGYCRLAKIALLPGFAVLALVTMPRFYGHGFNNSKDIPFACLIAWSMYTLASLFSAREFKWSQVLRCGLAFGLTLCVRPGGLPLLAAYFVAAATLSFLSAGQERHIAFDRQKLLNLSMKAGCLFAIAWVIMVLPWPWAHQAPIANPFRAMTEATSFSVSYPVLFEGMSVPSTALPSHYLAKFLVITAPPTVLLLSLVAIARGIRNRRLESPRSFIFWMSLVWLALPIALFPVLRPNVYDGIRHFLFVLPPAAVLSGFGATWICDQLRTRLNHVVAAALTAGLLVLPVKDLIALHPYQATYFNLLVGGVAGADGRYDTDYWLLSYREAIEWVNQQAAKNPGQRTTVAIAGDGYITSWVQHYASDNVDPIIVLKPPSAPVLPEGIDYYIATKRNRLDAGYPMAPIVHTVGRAGAVFTVIKGRVPTPNSRG